MKKGQEFVKRDKEHYGKVYVDIQYAISEISPFMEGKALENRKYVSRLPVLKKYIELLESAEREENKGGILSFFRSNDTTELLQSYKNDKRQELNQLEKCSKCQCLRCTANCKFNGCLGCRNESYIAYCDHEKINVTLHENFMIDLTNEKTGREETYKVFATLQDAEKDEMYIIMEGIISKEKYVLYYYPGISEDTYGEITDEEEFDFIVQTYESLEK